MTCVHDLPRLAVVPVERLILHEYHDGQRTRPLMDKLQASGVLRNPPIVSPFHGRQDFYMVLDGANRTSAFRELGIPHILVQIFDVDDPNMDLNAWNHIVWGMSPQDLISELNTIPDVNLEPSTQTISYQELMDIHALASIHLPDGNVYTICTPKFDLKSRLRLMNEMVSMYGGMADIDRTNLFEITSLVDKYEALAGLVILPPFEITEIMEVVGVGDLMPPGCTRFTISPRVLHINYPLEKLETDKSTDEKNAELQNFICALLDKKSVRFYQEPTYIFNE